MHSYTLRDVFLILCRCYRNITRKKKIPIPYTKGYKKVDYVSFSCLRYTSTIHFVVPEINYENVLPLCRGVSSVVVVVAIVVVYFADWYVNVFCRKWYINTVQIGQTIRVIVV